LITRNVADMRGLNNDVSNYEYADNIGNNIISNRDTVEVALGTYQYNRSGSNCASSSTMLYLSNL